uniref:Spatacsin n=2 Tax=Ceratitis capitata TaxID=7213 RepID=W8BC60_CERCA
MSASVKRDKLFKSWTGISEVALIKEVATKGENIDLCIEYWARKRKLPLPEYELFFQDVVQTYVQRLLTERLVCKAEMVLNNVKRDVKSFYYQFACECDDEELRELVMDHLQKKDPQNYESDLLELQFYWDLLQQLQASPDLLAKCKVQLRRVNIETLVHCNESYLNKLLAELYFLSLNPSLLKRLNKYDMWSYLVEEAKFGQLVRWCTLAGQPTQIEYTELDLLYCGWEVEAEMFELALKALEMPNETLRNCFASAGYFFGDEREDVAIVIRRLCTTESLERNRELLEKLPLGHFLLNRGLHTLLLRDFVKTRELEEMIEEFPDDEELLKFLVALKENKTDDLEEFEKVFQATKVYLEHQGIDFNNAQPLVTLFDFLSNEPSVANLNCYLHTTALQNIPYLKTLSIRNPVHNSESNITTGSDNCNNGNGKYIPTPYDFLRKFKQIDMKEVSKELQVDSLASFSNEKLCAKFGRKYKLNFLHYLKQQRSCYAVYYFVMDHLQQYGQLTKGHLFRACETVTEFALQHANNMELAAHCTAFIEMLGYDSQYLRNYLKLCRLLEYEEDEANEVVVNTPIKNFTQLLARVESLLLQRIVKEPAKFPLVDYQALMRIVVCSGQRQWPMKVMQHYACDDDWWRLLVLMQYFDVPLSQLQILIGHFESRAMGEHLLRSFLCEVPPQSKRHASFSRQKKKPVRKGEAKTVTTSSETITSITSACNDPNNAVFRTAPSQQRLHFLPDACGRLDLFAIVLLSSTAVNEQYVNSTTKFLELMQDQRTQATSWNLLRNCVKYRLPVLAVLAATVYHVNVEWQWLVWLAVATNQWTEVLKLSTMDMEKVSWLLLDTAVRQGDVCLLLRSFRIFFKENPFAHLCRFLQRTQRKRCFDDEDVHSLRLFLLAWSNDSITMPFCATLPRNELMHRSIRLLLVHLQHNFDSTLEQQKLINCMCRSDMSDISVKMDFCRLQAIFEALQTRPGWAEYYKIDFEQLAEENNQVYEGLLEELRAKGEYDVAVRLATLLQQPISDIVYTKWITKLDLTGSADDEAPYAESAFQLYEEEISEHSLPPELLVNFYLYAAGRLSNPCARKYQLLKRALTVIKQHHLFPNESFDRDQIEYEMIICYLQLDDEVGAEMGIYHSEYFEQIMLNERCVLYKSFLELKELAGIEDLNVSIKHPLTRQMEARLEAQLNLLLDKGDIVEALRLQELFECRPIDLRFVVFCMALAEGVTTIFSMSSEERQMLRDIEISSFAKFNKRTLDSGLLTREGQNSPSKASSDLTDSCSTFEFEEIPSKEKRETLETIQGIASKLTYGVSIGRRIVMVYRAAMYLDKEYLDVLRTKDTTVLLQSVSEEGCLHRLLVVSDILTSSHMTTQEIAELLALELATAIVRPRFYIFTTDQQAKNAIKNTPVWGYNIDRDLHLFLELVPNTTKLGNCLLEYCDALKAYRKFQDNKPYEHNNVFERLAEIIRRYGLPTNSSGNQMPTSIPPITTATNAGSMLPPAQVLSHKKQNIIYVELLIKAHQCYVHECSMEGIANVLNRAKALNTVLTNAKSWSLIVRMLSGIGRYREMFYCFDSLLKNEQFESLLGQFDEEKTIGLRQAIITYLREYCPNNGREYLKLTALHFLMYQELAEMWEQDAQAVLAKVINQSAVSTALLPEKMSMANLTSANPTKTFIPKLRCTPELSLLLQQAMEYYTHATENYLLDNKLLLAQRVASLAEMLAVQIDLANKAVSDRSAPEPHLCVCVVNVQTRDEFRELINAELSVPQSLILSRAYGYDINWSEVLLSQYVILGHANYLQEYLQHMQINDNIIENTVKGFQLYAQHHRISTRMDEHLSQLVTLIKSVTLKYKLASLLSLKAIVMSLINDQTSHYLRDTDFGRNENCNLNDM